MGQRLPSHSHCTIRFRHVFKKRLDTAPLNHSVPSEPIAHIPYMLCKSTRFAGSSRAPAIGAGGGWSMNATRTREVFRSESYIISIHTSARSRNLWGIADKSCGIQSRVSLYQMHAMRHSTSASVLCVCASMCLLID